jgi:electron transport complex protein RnfA
MSTQGVFGALEALSTLGALAVFSGLSLNLLLQFGIGIGGILDMVDSGSEKVQEKQWVSLSSPHWFILFGSPFVLWLFFTYVLPLSAFGFLESFLLFPAALLVSAALEVVFAYFFPQGFTREAFRKAARQTRRDPFNPWKLAEGISVNSAGLPRYSGNGLALASVFLTLRLAVSLLDALVLSLGFSLGCLAAMSILREINKRSSLETVPPTFRGAPLTLISMGLLSLIFSSVSVILLRVLGVFNQ